MFHDGPARGRLLNRTPASVLAPVPTVPPTTGSTRTIGWSWAMVAIVAVASTGCRLCCDTEDAAYPAYGGKWQRTIRDSGRVGSLFDSAGNRASLLVDRDVPAGQDELERQRNVADDDDSLDPDRPLDDDDNGDSDAADEMDRDFEFDDDRDADDVPDDLDDVEPSERERRLEDLELEDIEVRLESEPPMQSLVPSVET